MKKPTKKSAPPMSEARLSLAKLLEKKREIVAIIETLQAAAHKLEAQKKAAGPLQQTLAMLDASESQAMSEWAKSGGIDAAPKPDTRKRQSLTKAIATAVAGANAATAACETVTAEHLALHHRLGELSAPIKGAIAQIVVEEAGPLIDRYKVANSALRVQYTALEQALETIDKMIDRKVVGAGMAFDVSSTAGRLFGELHGTLIQAFERPPQDDDSASVSRAGWKSLVDGLQVDAATALSATSAKPAKPMDIAAIAKLRLETLARLGA